MRKVNYKNPSIVSLGYSLIVCCIVINLFPLPALSQSGKYAVYRSMPSLRVFELKNKTLIIDTGVYTSDLKFIRSFKYRFMYNNPVAESNSGRFYIASITSTFNKPLVLTSLDKNGNLISFKYFGNKNSSEVPIKIKIDSQNNIWILSISESLDTSSIQSNKTSKYYGMTDYWLLKLDSNGNKLSEYSFGGTYSDIPFDFYHKTNGNTVVAGYSYTNIASGNKSNSKQGLWVIEFQPNGTIIFDTVFNYNIFRSMALDEIWKYSTTTSKNDFIFFNNSENFNNKLVKIDKTYNLDTLTMFSNYKSRNILFDPSSDGKIFALSSNISGSKDSLELFKIDSFGNVVWFQELVLKDTGTSHLGINDLYYFSDKFNIAGQFNLKNESRPNGPINNFFQLARYKAVINGSVFPDFNSNCTYNKPSEYNIPNILIHNNTENTYAISNDSIYTMYLFDRDTAVLKIINLDTNLYVACGKDSIVVDMTGRSDTSGIDFPIRSNKTGHCVNITSFSSGLLRPGRWGDYQLNYQNNAFDTAYNAYIEIEIDTAQIDSIKSPYSFTLTGNILRFNIGHVRPFGHSSLTYSIKLKTTVIIGSSHCHRAKLFPICNIYPSTVYDSSEIQPMMRCLPNDTVEFTLKNIGLKDQKDWGHSIIYVDELILKKDSFKLTVGNSRVFKYKIETNKVFTAEVFNSNFHPVTPILIRHDDLCANRRPMIPQNVALNFSRHDQAKEYEEACTIVRGSYDPNIKSVQPIGFYSQHYTSTGTELKYRIDFQNTGTDTAFRVVLVDTLSTLLDISTFVPGISSHPYSVEFGGRAVKFIFDPIALVDSPTNEPKSHGFVTFKIKHVQGITPKSRIENKADIYFDYNAPIRTNTVFNTIFDTVLVYIPKVKDSIKDTTGGSSIQGINQTSILIFPNPTTDKFYIQLSDEVKDLSVEINDIHGRLVKQVPSKNDKIVEVSAEGMGKGIYHIRCLSGDKLIVVKKVLVE